MMKEPASSSTIPFSKTVPAYFLRIDIALIDDSGEPFIIEIHLAANA